MFTNVQNQQLMLHSIAIYYEFIFESLNTRTIHILIENVINFLIRQIPLRRQFYLNKNKLNLNNNNI